jgi:hypothetical protein
MPTPITESFSAKYLPRGEVNSADCVLVAEFGIGQNDTAGAVNERLVEFALTEFPGLPTIMNERLREVADSHSHAAQLISVEGGTEHVLGRVGTFGELITARDYMQRNRLGSLALVGQAFHISRIQRQAEMLEINTIVPAGLPAMFDRQSTQWWTRNRHAWRVYEAMAVTVLVRRGQL